MKTKFYIPFDGEIRQISGQMWAAILQELVQTVGVGSKVADHGKIYYRKDNNRVIGWTQHI